MDIWLLEKTENFINFSLNYVAEFRMKMSLQVFTHSHTHSFSHTDTHNRGWGWLFLLLVITQPNHITHIDNSKLEKLVKNISVKEPL